MTSPGPGLPQMLLMITVALATPAALNTILTARATMRGVRHASALMPALGANSRQVNAPSTGAVRAGWAPVPHANCEIIRPSRRLTIEATISL